MAGWLFAYLFVGVVVAGVLIESLRREGDKERAEGWVLFNVVVGWPFVIALAIGMVVVDLFYNIKKGE